MPETTPVRPGQIWAEIAGTRTLTISSANQEWVSATDGIHRLVLSHVRLTTGYRLVQDADSGQETSRG